MEAWGDTKFMECLARRTAAERSTEQAEEEGALPMMALTLPCGGSGGEPNPRLWLRVFRCSLRYLDNAVESVLRVSVSYMRTMGWHRSVAFTGKFSFKPHHNPVR